MSVENRPLRAAICAVTERTQQKGDVIMIERILHVKHNLDERIHGFYSSQRKIFVNVKVDLVTTPHATRLYVVIQQIDATSVRIGVAERKTQF